MGSRKDRIKRTLGISDYPWSSDDDLEEATLAAEEATLHRPPAEPRSNEPDAPGTSGVTAAAVAVQQILQHQQESRNQQQQQQIHPQLNPIPSRSHARLEREIFWSYLTSPDASSPRRLPSNSSRVRPSEIPVSYVSRVNHVPAPELRERNTERPTSDIQRIVAFKRLTRNLGPMRHRGHINGAIPATRVNPGVVVPSEANSRIPLLPYRRFRYVAGTSRPIPFKSGYHAPYMDLCTPSDDGRRRTRASPDGEDQDLTPPRQPSAHVQSAQDEINNNPIPSTADGADRDPILDDGNVEQDEPLEGDLEPEANNNSGANISLEEEIVAIDLDSSGTQEQVGTTDKDDVRDKRSAAWDARAGGDVRDAPGPSGARFAAEFLRPGADANMPSASDVLPSDASAQQPLTQSGVKRKRRESDDTENAEPLSVKEFNQNLLRLLECPVCLEWMEPPMSQCRRGHLVCSRCRARLASCPVCRTTFSSVRNRAMEGVAEMLRYPCRHGCGREVRLRRRSPHEASCPARKYLCPAPPCKDSQPLPRAQLAAHFQSRHLSMLKLGRRHRFSMKVNSEQHDHWLIMALEEYFHLRIDVDIRTWGVIVYVSYIGPKCDAKNFTYEVTIDSQHNQRKLVYARTTHSDLESSSLRMGRQDCFHLTLDQALNFIRFKNRHCDSEKYLDFNVEISKVEQPAGGPRDESDS